jgi:uncharacterized membrane protein
MKKYLLAGIATLLPIALTVMIIVWLINLLTTPFIGIVESLLIHYEKSQGLSLLHHDTLVLFLSRLVILVFLFFFTLLLGFFGRKITLRFTNLLFARIPFVNTVYRMSKEMTKAFFSQKQKAFKETVLVPFPNENTHALGLSTGEIPPILKEKIQTADLAVFVPTAPHPLSGYILMTSRKDAIPVNLSTEEVFKFLLSCGVSFTEEEKHEK